MDNKVVREVLAVCHHLDIGGPVHRSAIIRGRCYWNISFAGSWSKNAPTLPTGSLLLSGVSAVSEDSQPTKVGANFK